MLEQVQRQMHKQDPDRDFRASSVETSMRVRGPVTSTIVHKNITTVPDRTAGAYQQKLEWLPYPDGLCNDAFNDVDSKCCAVFIRPVQNHGGVTAQIARVIQQQ